MDLDINKLLKLMQEMYGTLEHIYEDKEVFDQLPDTLQYAVTYTISAANSYVQGGVDGEC